MQVNNYVRVKICRIKEFETAKLCAKLGVDFLGLHAISEIKPERTTAFQKIAQELPKAHPAIGIVLVTKQQDISAIVKMTETIKPSHIQLHNKWLANLILQLKDELQKKGYNNVKLIGVIGLLEEPVKQVSELKPVVDLLLLDRTLYSKPLPQKQTVDLSIYKEAMNLAGSVPILIAGGLTPENVKYFIDALHPFGVDVQSGVEYPDKPGVKDPEKISAFLQAVKSSEGRMK